MADASHYEVSGILERLMEHLQILTKSGRVIGDPIVLGDYTIVPLIQIEFGFGGGGGGGEDASRGQARGSGEGGGAGGSIQPIALLVLHQGQIQIYPLPNYSGAADGLKELGRKGGLGEIVASIPDILSQWKKKKPEPS